MEAVDHFRILKNVVCTSSMSLPQQTASWRLDLNLALYFSIQKTFVSQLIKLFLRYGETYNFRSGIFKKNIRNLSSLTTTTTH